MRLLRNAAILVAVLAGPASAQRIDWRTRAVLYADNTEFFTPYRLGETILGGQITSWLQAAPGPRVDLRLGAFADRRWGSDRFVDSFKPVLSFRFHTAHALGVLGTLETVNRHGLLEPLMVTTRELTTPIEYGGQWIESHKSWDVDGWLNWQKLNTPVQREQFEMGQVLDVRPARMLALRAQHLWYHRGGQLYNPVPVTNNHAGGIGVRLQDSIGKVVGRAYVEVWELLSSGHIDPDYPAGRPDHGHGTYFRAGLRPWNWADLFVIHWIGRDYSADAGDNNYNSTGYDQSYYQSHRVYTEIGAIRRTAIEGGATFDLELRFHNIDNLKSIAFFNSIWELSYRVVVRVPIDLLLRREADRNLRASR